MRAHSGRSSSTVAASILDDPNDLKRHAPTAAASAVFGTCGGNRGTGRKAGAVAEAVASIQNNSGQSQGPAGQAVLG
jgi:hypothetical protein